MTLDIGDVVTLTTPCLGNKPGTRGIVFNRYSAFDDDGWGVQIIFENGEYDGFSPEEQDSFLNFETSDVPDYRNYIFKNVMQVTKDFNTGFWRKIL